MILFFLWIIDFCRELCGETIQSGFARRGQIRTDYRAVRSATSSLCWTRRDTYWLNTEVLRACQSRTCTLSNSHSRGTLYSRCWHYAVRRGQHWTRKSAVAHSARDEHCLYAPHTRSAFACGAGFHSKFCIPPLCRACYRIYEVYLCHDIHCGIPLSAIAVRVKRAMRALSIARNMVQYTIILALVLSHTLFLICSISQW